MKLVLYMMPTVVHNFQSEFPDTSPPAKPINYETEHTRTMVMLEALCDTHLIL